MSELNTTRAETSFKNNLGEEESPIDPEIKEELEFRKLREELESVNGVTLESKILSGRYVPE
jgi:hypothetical protein